MLGRAAGLVRGLLRTACVPAYGLRVSQGPLPRPRCASLCSVRLRADESGSAWCTVAPPWRRLPLQQQGVRDESRGRGCRGFWRGLSLQCFQAVSQCGRPLPRPGPRPAMHRQRISESSGALVGAQRRERQRSISMQICSRPRGSRGGRSPRAPRRAATRGPGPGHRLPSAMQWLCSCMPHAPPGRAVHSPGLVTHSRSASHGGAPPRPALCRREQWREGPRFASRRRDSDSAGTTLG